VTPASICRTCALAGLVLDLAACGGDGGGSSPPNGPAQVSTLAYVVTRCHEEKGGIGWSGSQSLWVRQGERSPVKVAEFALGQPKIGGLCRLYAQSRNGLVSVVAGAFQRLGVTPDGSVVVFEVTDHFSDLVTHVIPEEQQGVFAVRADGAGLRKVAEHSAEASFRVYLPCLLAPGTPGCPNVTCVGSVGSTSFAFSRDGQRVTYTDLGPSDTGGDASQVFTLDLSTGERRQVTHLPALPVSPACIGQDAECLHPAQLPISLPAFLRDTTLAFSRGRGCTESGGGVFTVKADGTEAPRAVDTVALGDGAVLPVFQITGEGYAALGVLPGIPEDGVMFSTIFEVFVIEPPDSAELPGGRVLQLTNYGRSDTDRPRMSIDRQRVFFQASANPNPPGTNPDHQCQCFSIDRLGGNLRQLTSFRAAGDRSRTCADFASPGCTIGYSEVDMITGSLVFGSSCDPLGTNRTGAIAFFAIHPDGSGLRQLTDAHGMITNPDGSVDVELPSQFNVPARLR